VGLVVILESGRELLEDGSGIGPGLDAGTVTPERLHEGPANSIVSGLRNGVEPAARFIATAKLRMSRAA
jgi:hypothetical protein